MPISISFFAPLAQAAAADRSAQFAMGRWVKVKIFTGCPIQPGTCIIFVCFKNETFKKLNHKR